MTINLFNFNINILEIPVTLILFVIIFTDMSFRGTKFLLKDKRAFNTYLTLTLLFIISILLSSLTAIKLSSVIKSAFKWIEIFSISMLVFLYARNAKRFIIIYWLIFISTLLSIIVILVVTIKNNLYLFEDRLLPGYDSLFALALLVPFAFLNDKKYTKFISLLLLLSAILSLSRGVWIGVIMISGYFFYINRSKAVLKLVGLALPVIIIGVALYEPFAQFILSRLDEMFTTENVSNVERISMMKYAFVGFSQSPLWGIGALNFPHFLVNEGLMRGIVAKDVTVLEPHNLFLQTLTEEGIIGFFIIILFFLNIFIILFKNNSVTISHNGTINPYVLGLRILFIAIFINISLGFIANQFRFNFALFLGLMLSLTRINPDLLLDHNTVEKTI